MEVKTTLVTKLEQLYEMKYQIYEASYVSFDSETTGLERHAQAVGVSFAISRTESWYIPLQIFKDGTLVRPWSPASYLIVEQTIKDILLTARLITHNGAFDAKIAKNTFDIDIISGIYSDTQLLHHTCIDEGEKHALKFLATKYINPDADNPQQDLKDSVIANGGSWSRESKEMYKGDWRILGRYACFDVIYTYTLFDMWQPEIQKQGLETLWYEEVMPLLAITYELNTTGVRVNISYFEQLKLEMIDRLDALQDEVYAAIKDQVLEYEKNKVIKVTKITTRSEVGKLLLSKGIDPAQSLDNVGMSIVFEWYKAKHKLRTVFNLDSGEDKGFLIYDVMGITCTEFTSTGKRSTAKALIDRLAEENEDKSVVLKLMLDRSKETKMLSTYVLPILDRHENGRIYPSFMQTGTTSGRYSCGGSSLNLQTLPRGDERIKKGFIPDEGYSFVAADYSSLEPRAFAEASGEPKIQKIFSEGLDFYSSIAIDVLKLKDVSANPDDANYLGTVDKEKRQLVKAFALAVPYGAGGGRISQMLGISYEEGQELVNKYLGAYPSLKRWMDRSDYDMKTKGYVVSRMGRKKRGDIVKELHTDYNIKSFDKRTLAQHFPRLPKYEGIDDAIKLYLECRNTFNVSKNHQIQSLAASIINAAMVDLQNSITECGLDAKIMLMIHDEIVLLVNNKDVDKAAELLQNHMEHNKVSATMAVPLIAQPVITEISLAEAK